MKIIFISLLLANTVVHFSKAHAADPIGDLIMEIAGQEQILVQAQHPKPCPVTFNARGIPMHELMGDCVVMRYEFEF
jgi:hypothetical protein